MSNPPVIDTRLGELADLEGTWEGEGFNMLAVPDPQAGSLRYRIIAQKFKETLKFNRITELAPKDGVPNRRLNLIQFVSALEYTQHVVDEAGAAIHHENGLWLMLDDTVSPSRIARQSSIPHGNSLLAPGDTFVFPGTPQIDEICVLPSTAKGKVAAKMKSGMSLEDACAEVVKEEACGYLEPYAKADAEFKKQGVDYFLNPNKLLTDHNQNLNITSTSVYRLDTTKETGGVVNIPFFKPPQPGDSKEQVDNAITCPALSSTFWVNTVKNADGTEHKELQYTQDTTIEFFQAGPNGLIVWPHIDVANLKKVD